MRPSKDAVIWVALASPFLVVGCGMGSKVTSVSSDGINSDVAVSIVSGALNIGSGGNVSQNNFPLVKKASKFTQFLNEFNPLPLRFAWGMGFSCSGGSLSPPSYNGSLSNPYTYTPLSCLIAWSNSTTASMSWSRTFTLVYSSDCNPSSFQAFPDRNVGPACSVTLTTDSSGNTRTLMGPGGAALAVTHNTNGAGTGWDSSVSPAPDNGGVVVICGPNGCAGPQGSATVVIHGSRITGMKDGVTLFDHTVSTSSSGLAVTGSGVNRVINGSVTVQHNLSKFTATSTFNQVGYGLSGCCFPTSGTLSTLVKGGGSETLAFSTTCGEATLTQPNGTESTYTLQHCL